MMWLPVRIFAATLLAGCACQAHAITFTNEANNAGITYSGISFGASWGDPNGDGLPDLWLGNHNAPAMLFINDGAGGFAQTMPIAGQDNIDLHGAAWADFDNDGDQDLMVACGAEQGTAAGNNQFFVNTGGALVNSAATYGVADAFGRGRSPTWLDWNSDGRLDLLLVNNNERPLPPEAPTALYTFNSVSGAFATEPLTLHTQLNLHFAQLSFSNAALPGSNLLLVQSGQNYPDAVWSYTPSGFSDAHSSLALPNPIDSVKDVVVADFDNDLSNDLFTISTTEARLFMQLSGGMQEVSNSGITGTSGSYYAVAADFDNDMDLDLYLARSENATRSNRLYENQGDGTFALIASGHGASGVSSGFASGLATADYDNDGFVDILITNGDNWYTSIATGPVQLLRNSGNANHWLQVHLIGTTSNRDGIGARVVVEAGGIEQLREQNGGNHYRSQNHSRLHFGLAGHTEASRITVTWPSGQTQVFENIASDQILNINETAGIVLPAEPLPLTIAAVGANSGVAEKIIDTLASGAQALATSWVNNTSAIADAWVTFDLGTPHTVGELRLAPRGDRSFGLDIRVGNSLVGGQVSSPVVATCVTPGTDSKVPGSLVNCPIPAAVGRYVTVASNNRNIFKLHGAEIHGSVGNTPPIAAFTANLTAGSLAVNFDGSASTDNEGPLAVYTWEFGDGATGVGVTPSHTYAAEGTFDVTLTVTDGDGATGTRTSPVTVGNLAPTALFSATPVSESLAVEFDAASASDSDGTIVTYDWDFGDGAVGSGVLTSHVYPAAGDYNVMLTVTDDDGASSSTTQTISVVGAGSGGGKIALSIAAVGENSGNAGNIIDTLAGGEQQLATSWVNSTGAIGNAWVTLDLGGSRVVNQVSIAPRGNVTHVIDVFVGDSLVDGKLAGSPATTCNTPGTDTKVPSVLVDCPLAGVAGSFVTLKLRNRGSFVLHGLEVHAAGGSGNATPIAQFTPNVTAGSLTVGFDASASSDSEGPIAAYDWSFGDGDSGFGVTPEHTYSASGSYSVTLTVTDGAGATATKTATVNVSGGSGNTAPVAQFTATPMAGTLTVDFDGSGSFDPNGSISDYDWDFGDGNFGTGTAPSYSYASAGTYTVTLTVTDNEGATNVASSAVSVSDTGSGGRLSVSIAAVGDSSGTASNIIDELAGGIQNLATFWVNKSGLIADGWVTFDLGGVHSLTELRIAPQGNRNHVLDIYIGDTLVGGKVSAALNSTCTTAGTDAATPTVLVSCELGGEQGRYMTVKIHNRASLKLYGAELYGAGGS